MKRPQAGPFLGTFYFYVQIYKPYPKDAVCQISENLDSQFMRRFFKIHPNFTPFCPYWASIGASPLIFANFNPHSAKMLPTKFG